MALTLTKTASGVMGDKRYWLGTLAFDPSASKFLVFVEDGTTGKEAEAGNASDQSGITDVQLMVFGE